MCRRSTRSRPSGEDQYAGSIMSGPYLVIADEPEMVCRVTGDPVGAPHTVSSLLILELDAETAAAAGWAQPVSPREQVAERWPLTFERVFGEASA